MLPLAYTSNWPRQARLLSGWVLFAYVCSHFLNHIAGLISLPFAEGFLGINSALWKSSIGQLLLYGALLVHFGLALWSIYQRRSLRLAPIEAAQVLLGFSVPFLAAQHIVNTRVGGWMLDSNLNYAWEAYSYWVKNPSGGLIQMLLLCVVWLHACISLHFLFKLKLWFPKRQLALFTLALLVPTLALLGFISAGRTAAMLAGDPSWLQHVKAVAHVPNAQEQAMLYGIRDQVWLYTLGLILATLAARGIRRAWQSRRGLLVLTYPNEQRVQVMYRTSVLEASRIAGIPHASVCGGRARCSTCRVRVLGPTSALPPADEHELRVLRRVGAPADVRLACQLRPTGPVLVTPLLPPSATARDGFARSALLQGSEREIAILFADIRSFTQIAEHRLPYDVVFLLNRYFAEMGHAVESAGGRVDKFIGDGVMALFGMDCDIGEASQQALQAARNMSEQLQHLNISMASDLTEPLRMGIGLHAGTAIVGKMGYGDAVSVTAIGDAVNSASRLEALCKDHACELVVSQDLADHAGIDLSDFPHHLIEIRGRETPMAIYTVASAQDTPKPATAKLVTTAAQPGAASNPGHDDESAQQLVWPALL